MKILFPCLGTERSGCDYAIVTLTDSDLKTLAKRRKTFLALHAEEPDLSSMVFRSIKAEYFPGGDWVDEIDDDGTLESDSFLILPDDFETEEEADRTECDRMEITEDGVFWTCFPKHEDSKVETHEIPWERLLGDAL